MADTNSDTTITMNRTKCFLSGLYAETTLTRIKLYLSLSVVGLAGFFILLYLLQVMDIVGNVTMVLAFLCGFIALTGSFLITLTFMLIQPIGLDERKIHHQFCTLLEWCAASLLAVAYVCVAYLGCMMTYHDLRLFAQIH